MIAGNNHVGFNLSATRLAEHGQELGTGNGRLHQRSVMCCVRIGLAISEAFSFMGAHIPALRLGNPFGCIPRPFLPDGPRGQAQRLRLVPPPADRLHSFQGIKGEGFARDPHPFPALRFGLRLPVSLLVPLAAKRLP